MRLLAKLKIKNCGIKNITWMYTRYVSLIIIWKTNKEEQPRQKSIVVGYFWCFLSHRIVIISYYQTCNGFLVQCICMACVVKMINCECMFPQTDIISAVVVLLYWGLFMTSRFRYEGFKNNSFFTSSEVHLACSERVTFVLV